MKFLARTGVYFFICWLFVSVTSAFAVDSKKLKSSVKIQESVESAAIKSQKKIDGISDETDRMLTEYKLVLRQFDALNGYNNQVQKIVDGQVEELSSMDAQLTEIDSTNQGVIPLMSRMVETIQQFVQIDAPFLPKERSERVEGLKDLLDRADVTVSEKYRRIMEAYQVEMEYGRTIEAYTGDLKKDGNTRSVDFLRIGRVALMYQTLDKKEAAVWDQDKKNWQLLSDEYRKPVSEGLKIANKQAPPNLIKLPIRTPEKL